MRAPRGPLPGRSRPKATVVRGNTSCRYLIRSSPATRTRTRHRVLHYPRHVIESVAVLIASGTAPAYSHPGDAGADLVAAEAVVLGPGERATVGTGVSIALPDGYAAFVVPRSGLAARHGITIVNSPGTVDAGYRGEIRVTLLNTDRA